MSGRRNLLRGAAAAPAVVALPVSAQPDGGTLAAWRAGRRDIPPQPPLRFLDAAEAAFVSAAVDLLIPADDQWPGAVWAGVPSYIDGQLAGAWGQGARLYKEGPWEPGVGSQGYQLPHTPQHLYRRSLAALRQAMPDFATAEAAAQTEMLRAIEAGRVDCGGYNSAVFFETLLANTVEGWFADPAYGGNRDMVGWRMIGFPGAHAAWLPTYVQHGVRHEGEPHPMGDAGAHQHAASPLLRDASAGHGHAPGPRHGGHR
ncbi:MAG: gluconate 2-dehydrogenase subunit 3 family protein [Acetobacteraceae bacterium]|nr:gluconate 2-dehydrogenase subunit 3 family protein [Acetobacteraceae bacterium]